MKESLITSLRLKIQRCLLAGPDGPDVNYTPPRSKYFLAWGAGVIHFWSALLGGGCGIAATGPLDFVMTPGQGKMTLTLDSKDFSASLYQRKQSVQSLFTSSPLLPQYVKKPLGQVGMFLDYDGGILSFFNVANSSLICSFLLLLLLITTQTISLL